MDKSWKQHIAQANTSAIELNDMHWHILGYLKTFYEQSHKHPPMRLIIKDLKQHFPEQAISNQSFYDLFGPQPLKTACKIAELPKPPHCI
jgi:tRNA 2-thiouridine synthesizing protein E